MTTLNITSVIGTGDPFDGILTIPFKGGRECMGEEWAPRFELPLPAAHHAVGSRVWNVAAGPDNSAGSIVFCEACHQAFYPKKPRAKRVRA